MKAKRHFKEKKSRVFSKSDLFTGGKLPEFAIYYNIAFFRLAGYLNFLLGNSYESDKKELEKVFKQWRNKLSNHIDLLSASAYSKLRDYLWKAYTDEKNSSAYALDELDIKRLNGLLIKLNDIRNFQSHIWHDNQALIFDKELSGFIEELHQKAVVAQRKHAGLNDEVNQYLSNYCDSRTNRKPSRNNTSLFDKHDGKYYIKQDGRVFFLSIFLSRGEMNRFLQLTKGYKRNDIPEFKIKRKIFEHYTHRDGASRSYYGFDENMINSLPPGQKEETLLTRQAFKLLGYLNDIPGERTDTDVFPLFLANEKKVENAMEMLEWCQENQLISGISVNLHLRGEDEQGNDIYSKDKLELQLTGETGERFVISTKSFHQLILDVLRNSDKGEHIVKMLKLFSGDRKWLKDFVNSTHSFHKKETEEQEEDRERLNEYLLFRLRGNDYLKKKMASWHESFGKGNLDVHDLKSQNFREALGRNPVELNYYSFFYEQDYKPRATDKFVEWAINYLIDFNITPDWEWMFESFDKEAEEKEVWDYGKTKKVIKQVNKRKQVFSTKTPDKSRLAKQNNHVVCRLKQHPETRFSLGFRTIKNLLIALAEGKDIQHFLARIHSDINKVLAGKHELKYLTANEIPAFMKPNKSKADIRKNREALEKKATARIDYILEAFPKRSGEKITGLSRAERNRQIMRCYKFFDWKYPGNTEVKFLRKDEYQRLSVYHYSLKDIGRRAMLSNRYSFLLSGITEHMPPEVKILLEHSKDLDELLNRSLKLTEEKLRHWKRNIHSFDEQEFAGILSKISLKYDKKEENTYGHIPFDVHPILPLRMYFNQDGNYKNTSLSKLIRESKQAEDLKQSHYEYSEYLKLLPRGETKLRKKLTGQIDQVKSKDTILWYVAQQYLKRMNPAIKDLLFSGGLKSGNWQFSNIRQINIPFPLEIDKWGKVFIELKFHQLDDYLLVESKPLIKKVVEQLFYRYDEIKDDKNTGISKKEGVHYISFEEVHREMSRIYHQSYIWAGFIQAWEKKLIFKLSESKRNEEERKPYGFDYISFKQVLEEAEHSDNLKERIKQIRNAAFHADIPSGWSYQQMEEDKEVCAALGFKKSEKPDYSIKKES